jgi:peptidoglycan hydrolase-like protein with peptidoglycan-binding domain
VSAVYRKSDHHDPGPNFPWDHFLAEVKNELGVAPPVVDAAVAPAWPGRYFVVRNPPMLGNDVKTWQRQMRQRGWDITISGAYSAQSAGVCRAFQQEKGLEVDGVVGPATWRAAWTEPVT